MAIKLSCMFFYSMYIYQIFHREFYVGFVLLDIFSAGAVYLPGHIYQEFLHRLPALKYTQRPYGSDGFDMLECSMETKVAPEMDLNIQVNKVGKHSDYQFSVNMAQYSCFSGGTYIMDFQD